MLWKPLCIFSRRYLYKEFVDKVICRCKLQRYILTLFLLKCLYLPRMRFIGRLTYKAVMNFLIDPSYTESRKERASNCLYSFSDTRGIYSFALPCFFAVKIPFSIRRGMSARYWASNPCFGFSVHRAARPAQMICITSFSVSDIL